MMQVRPNWRSFKRSNKDGSRFVGEFCVLPHPNRTGKVKVRFRKVRLIADWGELGLGHKIETPFTKVSP